MKRAKLQNIFFIITDLIELMRLYNYVLQRINIKYNILYSLDCYDEISLTSEFKVINNKSEKILSPSIFNLDKIKENKIAGGQSIESSAKIFMNLLNNNGTKEKKKERKLSYLQKLEEEGQEKEKCILLTKQRWQ